MSLPEGVYIIESKENGAAIGRNPREDRSLRPKPVVIHPVGEGLLPQASVRLLSTDILSRSTLNV
ncbi:hypothetical protein EST38_g10480 [Candolleomyces aberdarensis]|uniref:Uncharacterized protein n=1 Tax=Candolleomyces aberdarensis TaxID=2316362 RepID=A0A4Q2D7A0_9AGAR|nr:hypothetical protein EST38_g10480 [Candolleomyces aberdarensis]